jgi:hypothetical protein
LNSRSARVTPCEAMRVGATPKRQAVHSGAGAQTRSGRGVRKAERRSAAGRRKGPEAVTELVRNGTGRHALATKQSPLTGDAIPRQTRSPLLASDLWTKSRISHRVSRVFHSTWSRSRAHNKGVISFASPCPRRLCIAAPPIRIPSVLQSIGPALEFKPLRRRKPGRFPSSRSTGPRGCIPRR